MTDYLLAAIIFVLCLGGIPLDGRVKSVIYVVMGLASLLYLLSSLSGYTITR